MKAAVRCVIDAMVFDAVSADLGLLAEVERLTSARRLELLAASVTLAEVAATPSRAHRRRLQRVRVLALPPVDPDDGVAAALAARLDASPGVSAEDAAAALAAATRGVPLVTEDRALRAAAQSLLPDLRIWSIEELCRRLAILTREHPPGHS